jgi:hypothetical protein
MHVKFLVVCEDEEGEVIDEFELDANLNGEPNGPLRVQATVNIIYNDDDDEIEVNQKYVRVEPRAV